jgi:4-amino-4-deoxy-L-arabinose transferase-like glycosyltransferase
MFRKLAPLFLLLVTSAVYLVTATDRALLDDGDALYAAIALQMAEGGDWVTPVVNGVRFLDKPPMMYWLMALSFRTIGHSEFAARLPSALAVVGTSWLLYLIASGSVHRVNGFIAGLVSAMCVGTFLFTRMVFPDILLVFFLTLAMAAFWRWYRDPGGPARPALLYCAALAGAVLTKGIVGILFPAAIVILFLAWSRDLAALRRFPFGKGAILFLVIALPWHMMAAIRTPGFLWYFFVNEQLLRFLGRRIPADYESISVPAFWILCLVWLFPWSAFLPAIRAAYLRSAGIGTRPLLRLSLCWAATILGFFTFSSRIEHYSLPLIAPAALLIGITLTPANHGPGPARTDASRWVDRGFAALALLGIAVGLAVTAALVIYGCDAGPAQSSGTRHTQAYPFYFAPLFDLPQEMVAGLRAPAAGMCAALALGFPAAWWVNRRGRRMPAVLLVALVMAAFDLLAFQSLGICEDAISSRQFGRELGRVYRPGDSLITFGDYEAANSINFYAPMPLEMCEGTAAVLSWGLRYQDAPRRILSQAEMKSRWNGPSRTFLLVPDARIADLSLKRPYEVLRSAGRTLLCNQRLQ